MRKISAIKPFPFFLLLLPLFFVLHGYGQNISSVTGSECFELVAEYLLVSGLLFLLGLLSYRRWQKAALFSFGLLFVHLFFGAFHDGLKRISGGFFLAKYSVLLPLLALLLIFFLLYLKRSKGFYKRFFVYLNLIFAVLVLIDLPRLFSNSPEFVKSGMKPCTTCDKPDVYFIVADEYADSVSLSELMHFNNGAFQSALRERGFHVVNGSRGNYNFTPFAVASLFRMDYLQNIVGSNSNRKDINICQTAINRNPTIAFFKENGYEIKNLSIFTVDGQPAQVKQGYLVMGKDLITSQTLLQRLQRDLGYHLVTTLKIHSEIERYAFYTKRGNDKLISLLQKETRQKNDRPRFIYTHLLMPHYPYYFDKNDRQRPLSFLVPGHESNREGYIEYLQYANKIFLNLIDDILKQTAHPPIIIFMGDHGFREYGLTKESSPNYNFMNLNTVLLPNRNYAPFYDGISGVNQFRALFNSSFDQRLPMLKDSTRFLQE